ncbi:MAG: tyrosine-type recombinase/integrase [Bacteroidetes bacterium]|nr:tyrosine-type recombinase/integrase [Bacteroidota bacterium]
MKGCRSLTDREADQIASSFRGRFALRDRAIFTLGRYTGERISAILQLKIGDIVQCGRVTDEVTYRRASRKGKVEGRTVKLHPRAKTALIAWIKQRARAGTLSPDDYVFESRKGQLPISRIQYHRILKSVVHTHHLSGKIATHSMRKTFADRIYDNLGQDMFRTQRALGHKNINSTVQYLSFREADIEEAILAM